MDDGTLVCQTLELPWRGNQHNISCVPEGVYAVEWLYSPKHQRHLYHLMDVPDRGQIEIHIGNTVLDTDGCILVGLLRGDVIGRDGETYGGILFSAGAFAAFNLAAKEPAGFLLTIAMVQPPGDPAGVPPAGASVL